MQQLLEDYKRRLETIKQMISKLPSNCPTDKPDYIRYKTKKECYRTFISELEMEIRKQKC